MRMRTSLDRWSASLLATFGVLPTLACGGKSGDSGVSQSGSASGASSGTSSGSSSGAATSGASVNSGVPDGGSSAGASAGASTSGMPVGSGVPEGGSAAKFPCTNPRPLVAGAETGFEVCDSGFIHRPAVHTCPSKLPRAGTCSSVLDGGALACSTDTDCKAQPNGMCGSDPNGGGPVPFCQCFYGCTSDADCGSGKNCLCGDPVGVCIEASCTSDADCGAGLLCTMSAPLGTCPSASPFACQTPQDTCGGDRDCAPNGSKACRYSNSHHECVQACFFGRPFLVRGSAQTADVARRSDWQASDLNPDVDVLSPEQREALGRAWARMAQMEHASIAAFARFALQLLSVGAPASLIEQTYDAMRDETEHAKMCFALAGSYLGHPVGPATLPVGDALSDLSPEAILVTTILEGCIGETVAAIEAAEALEHARDPVLRGVLSKIAEDEKRHAGLAWQYVRWATSQDAQLRVMAAAVFASAATEGRPSSRPSVAGADGDLLKFGIVSEAFRQQIRANVLLNVIAPCARALLALCDDHPPASGERDRLPVSGERGHAADSQGCRERSSVTGSSPAAMGPVFASTTR
jgi:hypothetical protein